jgi:PRTRC genetic system protein C
MGIEIKPLTRVFQYNGMTLTDIDPNMAPEEVRDVYAAQYGELTTAEIIDHGIENDTHRYEFRKQVGTKG